MSQNYAIYFAEKWWNRGKATQNRNENPTTTSNRWDGELPTCLFCVREGSKSREKGKKERKEEISKWNAHRTAVATSEWATHKKWSHSNNLFSRRKYFKLEAFNSSRMQASKRIQHSAQTQPKRKRAVNCIVWINFSFVSFSLEQRIWKFQSSMWISLFLKQLCFTLACESERVRERELLCSFWIVKTCQLFVFMFVCFLFRLHFNFLLISLFFYEWGKGKGLIYMVKSLWIAPSDVLVSAI